VSFGNNNFGGTSKSFDSGLSKNFDKFEPKNVEKFKIIDNPFKFTPKETEYTSRIGFYDHDALWTRWRRGYELYTITQSFLGSSAEQRSVVGDYRFYCAYQLYPGIFIPARLFTFPTTNEETSEQIVGIRDANGINLYDYSLPILAVRYLSAVQTTTYTQSGNNIVISCPKHGFKIGESVYLVFTSGTAVTATLPITARTENTFTCLAAAPLTTSGTVSLQLSTDFADLRWVETRVRLRSIFNPIPDLLGERLVDRAVERDPGITSSYTRSGSVVSVTCSTEHGLATGNTIFANVLGGSVVSQKYTVTVISTTQLQFNTIDSGVTGGTLIVSRLIAGYDYGNYVGYTLTGIDNVNTELIFQREDSYGAKTVNNKPVITVPAERGFIVGRYLTTEMRYQCSCQDFTRRAGFNLYKASTSARFPVTPITSVKPGQRLDKTNNLVNERDDDGVFHDLGFVASVSNFNQLPNYGDTAEQSYYSLYYYQLRWCKHVYAAFFSINHDEGNASVSYNGRYAQTGPNITVTINQHGLLKNNKIQINFTSGSAISGEYTVTEVVDSNTFKIVYPFSNTTNGYCSIGNIRRHQFVESWLIEPSDKPVGDALDTFYKNFNNENKKLRRTAEVLYMKKRSTKWVGATTAPGDGNLPEEKADYSPQLVSMLLTDNIRRADGELNRSGALQNGTQQLIFVINKLFNVPVATLLGEKFGMLDQPLYNYTPEYQYGLINNSNYLNGVPYSVPLAGTTTSGAVTEDAASVTVLDCGSYDPYVNQELVISGVASGPTVIAPVTVFEYNDYGLYRFEWTQTIQYSTGIVCGTGTPQAAFTDSSPGLIDTLTYGSPQYVYGAKIVLGPAFSIYREICPGDGPDLGYTSVALATFYTKNTDGGPWVLRGTADGFEGTVHSFYRRDRTYSISPITVTRYGSTSP
jgi:hypothetical protein